MKNFMEWFRAQTQALKITITLSSVAFITIILFIIGSFISQQVTNTPDTIPTPKPTPTSTATPSPKPIWENPVPDGDEPVLLEYNYTSEQITAALDTANNAAMAQCKIAEGETEEQTLNRLAQYFTSPKEVLAASGMFTKEAILEQNCNILGTSPTTTSAPEGQIKLTVTGTQFYTTTDQANKAPADRIILRKSFTYNYILQLQSDNTWKVIGI